MCFETIIKIRSRIHTIVKPKIKRIRPATILPSLNLVTKPQTQEVGGRIAKITLITYPQPKQSPFFFAIISLTKNIVQDIPYIKYINTIRWKCKYENEIFCGNITVDAKKFNNIINSFERRTCVIHEKILPCFTTADGEPALG